LRLGSFPAAISREQLHADLADLLADYVDRPIHELDTSGALNQFLDIIHSYSIALPPPLLLVVRTLIELDGAGRALSPQFSLAEAVQSFSGDIVRRRLSPTHLLTRAQRATAYWGRALEALPRDLDDVMGRIRQGSFAVRIEHRRLGVITNRLVLGMVVAALLISSALLWSAKAPPLVGDAPILGIAGYLLAAYLGWRLSRAMRHSDDDNDLP
jgi:ubiquinone biosynthesis protein